MDKIYLEVPREQLDGSREKSIKGWCYLGRFTLGSRAFFFFFFPVGGAYGLLSFDWLFSLGIKGSKQYRDPGHHKKFSSAAALTSCSTISVGELQTSIQFKKDRRKQLLTRGIIFFNESLRMGEKNILGECRLNNGQACFIPHA